MALITFLLLVFANSLRAHPHLYQNYPTYNPYANQPFYTPQFASSYFPTPNFLPTLNVLAETPYAITNRFTVVPMYVMAKDTMRTITSAHIMRVSPDRPQMTVKTPQDQLVQCTPAVRIHLERPITVYSLKTSILFPSSIEIVHDGFRIPIAIGAVIAPVQKDLYVSVDTPVTLRVVYAIPTKPFTVDYVNSNGVLDVPDSQSVIVDSEDDQPPRNITVIDFPLQEAEPILAIDEDDAELVNRNPPIVLAPGGIVQSTQPFTRVEPFLNSKESPILIALREEAKKRI